MIEDRYTQRNRPSLIMNIVALIIFVIILIIVTYSFIRNYIQQTTNGASPYVTIAPLKGGKIWLETLDSKQTYSTKEQIVVRLLADSLDKNITGYDIDLKYSESVEFVSSKSLTEDFDIFTKSNKPLKVTAIKKPEVTEPSIFTQTPIIEIVFKANQAGKVNFVLNQKAKALNESNLIDENTKDILVEVENLQLSIK